MWPQDTTVSATEESFHYFLLVASSCGLLRSTSSGSSMLGLTCLILHLHLFSVCIVLACIAFSFVLFCCAFLSNLDVPSLSLACAISATSALLLPCSLTFDCLPIIVFPFEYWDESGTNRG